jgi:serine/threonine protein kinase
MLAAISLGIAQREEALFTCNRVLGEGAFGTVFDCTHRRTDMRFAMKVEARESKSSLIAVEAMMYRLLAGAIGIPRCAFYGREKGEVVMVMDALGPSVERLFSRCKRKFTLKTICMIAEQLLDRIEYVHSRGVVHRDIKPDNLLIGSGDRIYLIYLIDFGLAKRFIHCSTGDHIPPRDDKCLLGTPRFASIHNHMGKGATAAPARARPRPAEQSRRDDLESVAYVLIYLFRGSLPWQGISAETPKEKYRRILEMKIAITIDELCAGMPRTPRSLAISAPLRLTPRSQPSSQPSSSTHDRCGSKIRPTIHSFATCSGRCSRGSGSTTIFTSTGSNPRTKSETQTNSSTTRAEIQRGRTRSF